MLDRTMWIYIYVIAEDTHSPWQLRSQITVRYFRTIPATTTLELVSLTSCFEIVKLPLILELPPLASCFKHTMATATFFYWRYNPLWVCILQPSSGAIASSRARFLDHTQRRTTVGRTPLDEWSIRRGHRYY